MGECFRLACVIMLVGCSESVVDGPDAQGYKWVKGGPTGIPVIHRGVDTFLYCGLEPGAKSCAIIAEGICNVYLPPRPEPWQEPHELRHCRGERHPGVDFHMPLR